MQTANEHVKKAGPTLRFGSYHTNLSTRHHPRESKTRGSQQLAWFCRIKKVQAILTTFCQKRMRRVEWEYIWERSERASEYLTELVEGIYFSKPISKDWRR